MSEPSPQAAGPSVEFAAKRRVQFAETDMAGIVHFANYFRYMEEVEHAFFRSVGLSVSMKQADAEIGWPRVAATCEYFGPVRFEDELDLILRVLKVGEKSLTYEVEFQLAGRRVARGETTSVCCVVSPGGGLKAAPIPAEIRRKLSSPSLGVPREGK